MLKFLLPLNFRFTSLLLVILIAVVSTQVSCRQNETTRIEFALGTVCVVSLFDNGQDKIYNDIFSRLREIENLMSVNIPSSDVSRVNASSGIEPVIVHENVFTVIERAKYFAELSLGAFDPTVGPLVSLWGIGSDNQRVPSLSEIEKAISLINWRIIELNAETKSVFLTETGMALDLGAIAKGYAADETALAAIRAGVKRAKIDLGGNIILIGEKTDKTPWRVGIQNPEKERGNILGIAQTSAPLNFPALKTIVTSGIYERNFEENGKRYHHIFDPSTGYPSYNGLLSVTIITNISMDADALSTAVFVLGYEKGSALLESFPETEAIFVFEDRSVKTTPGANFTLTDTSYRIEH